MTSQRFSTKTNYKIKNISGNIRLMLLKLGTNNVAKLLPWQQHSGRHFVSYLMHITGAKFGGQYHSDKLKILLVFVIYFCTETICGVISY